MKNFRIALALSLVCALFVPSVQADDEIVWFVHGLVVGDNSFTREVNTLKSIYPNANSVSLKKWNSPRIGILNILDTYPLWKDAVFISENYASKLAKEIAALSPDQRNRMILIGHSLGGRIVVRTAAILQKENIQIKKIILAGAAIDNDDKDIAATWAVSKETVENIINTQDCMLAVYNAIGEKHPALGTGYKSINVPDSFREIIWEGSICHFGYKYFDVYNRYRSAGCPPNKNIVVPQKKPNLDWSTMNMHVWWNVLDEYYGWELQINNVSKHCRIVDDEDVRRAWGFPEDIEEMKEIFAIVKFRLFLIKGKPEKQPLPPKWWLRINPIQDEFNANTGTMGGTVWWDNLDTYKGWKLQKNSWTGHCRILDPNDTRRAWGDESKMRRSFEDVKTQINALFARYK